MMGRSHAVSGFAVGLALAPVAGLHTAPEVLPFAATTAGYALVPDLDCAGATASRLLGPVTRALSAGIRAASARLYAATKGPRDEDGRGSHRHLTHTLLFAAVLGGLVSGVTAACGPWAVVAFLVVGLALAIDTLGLPMLLAAAAGLGGFLAAGVTSGPGLLSWLGDSTGWVGLAAGTGAFVHCLGDTVTRAGCPWLFPVPIAGETWYEIGPPEWARFRAGGTFEHIVVLPALVLAAMLLMPGVWPHLVDLLTWLR